jgi:hypothetical protein
VRRERKRKEKRDNKKRLYFCLCAIVARKIASSRSDKEIIPFVKLNK